MLLNEKYSDTLSSKAWRRLCRKRVCYAACFSSLMTFAEVIAEKRFVARDHLVLSLARKLLPADSTDHDEFLVELDTLIYDISQTHTTIETARRECATYAGKHAQYTDLIGSITKEIEVLRSELKEAYETKGRYDQYLLLTQAYNKLPTRQQSSDRIDVVEAEIKELNREHEQLERRMDLARKDMALLFTVLTSLSNRKEDQIVDETVPDDAQMDIDRSLSS